MLLVGEFPTAKFVVSADINYPYGTLHNRAENRTVHSRNLRKLS